VSIGYLKENVADSTTFRTWVEAEDAAGAKEHIYETAEKEPGMPFALITAEAGRAERNGMGVSDSYQWEGGLALWFDAIATSTDDRDAIAAFMVRVQPIIEEILEYSGRPGYLSIESIETEGAGFAEIDRKDADGKKTVQIKYMVRWK
jgi:hypothetical protein